MEPLYPNGGVMATFIVQMTIGSGSKEVKQTKIVVVEFKKSN
jgi:hypothetical protein